MRTIIVLLLAILLVGSGCSTKAGTGTAVGGVTGGALGYAVGGGTGLLVGAALGGLFGYGIGKSMDDEDRRRAAYALEQNRAMEWENAQGHHYQMVPTQTVYREGRECRNFKLMGEVDGKPDTITGTACRRPDGTWETISG